MVAKDSVCLARTSSPYSPLSPNITATDLPLFQPQIQNLKPSYGCLSIFTHTVKWYQCDTSLMTRIIHTRRHLHYNGVGIAKENNPTTSKLTDGKHL